MYFFNLFIEHAPLPLVIRYVHIIDYLLREEQWLWITTAPLQLVRCFGITSQSCMVHLCSHYNLLQEFKVNRFDKNK